MPALIKSSRTFSDALLQRHRRQGDAPADAVITAIVETGGPAGLRLLMGWLADTKQFATDTQPEVVQAFFAAYNQLPTWADPRRMARGIAFFNRHAGQIGLTLGCLSLPYCYLGAHGAQVLWLTERIKNDTARRLQETGEWVFGVNNPKEWPFTSTGQARPVGAVNAIARTLKIRLIHAGARWFSLHSGRWDMAWGYPINQEDMAATSLAFSYVMLRGLRKAGINATEQEEEDYLHHLNVVGFINGVAQELIPQNLREAYLLDRAITQRQFAPSEAGVGLTRALLNAIGEIGGSASNRPDVVRNLAAGEMRFFLGDQHADWLGVPDAPVGKRLAGLLTRLPIFPSTISATPFA